MMPRTRVKFCGVMRPEDAAAAARAGADAVGMILHADAKRRIGPGVAARIVAALPPYVAAVGVFVDTPADIIIRAVVDLSLAVAQLHGNESPDDVAALGKIRVVKAFRADTSLAVKLATWKQATAAGRLPNLVGLLIDGPAGGGQGVVADFSRLRELIAAGAFEGLPPLILAGGLKAENVGPLVREFRPFAVDTSSGIESVFGEKSAEKMQAFYEAASGPLSRALTGEG